ncbi:MAG: ABC transporter ATP-binding protein [Clostridiales bacterium]|jgi:peptide/nickel transport system ATP-binding protein|nr:ABC transporter ATP-binding protein [Clostridiales bacterium]
MSEAELNRGQKLRDIKRFNAKKYKELEQRLRHRSSPSEWEAVMKDSENVLEIDGLKVHFYTDIGTVKAVDGASISIPRGKSVGIVGESGCGKTVTSLSIMRLLQEPQGQIAGGAIRFNPGSGPAVDLSKLPQEKMERIRGGDITMIFQEPMTTLNPVLTIGKQLDEAVKFHSQKNSNGSRRIAARSVEMLKAVGIANAEGVYRMHPHELSGGMRQRVVIAMALMCDPKLIIADEPTTALDVTIQAQILDLLRSIKSKTDASIMLITHDLGVVSEMADIVLVMYAGRVVEQGPVREIFHNPCHPYTIGLMLSRPGVKSSGKRLYSIPGNVPNPVELPDYCFFRSRCDSSIRSCAGAYPPMARIDASGHCAACYRHVNDAGGASHGKK